MNKLRVCTQCGFTHAEFVARGLLGCPECYASFGDTLFADLLHLHPDLYLRPAPQDPARLREKFSEALRLERYEEAANLRQQMVALGLDPRA